MWVLRTHYSTEYSPFKTQSDYLCGLQGMLKAVLWIRLEVVI